MFSYYTCTSWYQTCFFFIAIFKSGLTCRCQESFKLIFRLNQDQTDSVCRTYSKLTAAVVLLKAREYPTLRSTQIPTHRGIDIWISANFRISNHYGSSDVLNFCLMFSSVTVSISGQGNSVRFANIMVVTFGAVWLAMPDKDFSNRLVFVKLYCFSK